MKGGWRIAVFSLLMVFGFTVPVCAEIKDSEEIVGDTMDRFDLSEIQEFIEAQEEAVGWNLSFEEVMQDLMAGDLNQLCGKLAASLKQVLFAEIGSSGRLMGQIVVLGMFGAVFSNFSSVFQENQISETGFFVTYLLLFTFLLSGFFQSMAIAERVVRQILEFMKVVMPSYFLAVAFSGGALSSAAMYEFTLWMITLAQWLLGTCLIPLIRVYMLLTLAGHISKEDLLSKLTELLEQMIRWSLKTLIGVVIGFHMIQGLILPYVDALKNTTVQKLMGVIPGIGQGAAAITQIVLGSGVLVKNTIGMAAVLILLILAAIPILKLLILVLLYQMAAAMLEPICDKRLVSCMSAVSKGHKLLLELVMAAVLLFIITVALVCAGTNIVH
ncbi:MAG: stage III sporulation protein AE [Hungatella sp.]